MIWDFFKNKKLVADEGLSSDLTLADLGRRYRQFLKTGVYNVSNTLRLSATSRASFEKNEELKIELDTVEHAFALTFLTAFVKSAKNRVVGYDAKSNCITFTYKFLDFITTFRDVISFLEILHPESVSSIDIVDIEIADIVIGRLTQVIQELYNANRDVMCSLGYPCHGIVPFSFDNSNPEFVSILMCNMENMNPHKANCLFTHVEPRADFVFEVPQEWIY